mmetsp:Transcript_23981/g.35945  ORF Transcript_23981/g.35945 Transcript_23981/m.35945 type:complete len:647 (+) Transcript_23981:2807-4747(+)
MSSLSTAVINYAKTMRMNSNKDWDLYSTRMRVFASSFGYMESFILDEKSILDDTVATSWKPQEVIDLSDADWLGHATGDFVVPDQAGLEEGDAGYLTDEEIKTIEKRQTKRLQAHSILMLTLNPSLYYLTNGRKDPTHLWAVLRLEFEGPRILRLVKLYMQLYGSSVKDYGGDFGKYAQAIQEKSNKLKGMGKTVLDEDRIAALISGLSEPKYSSVVDSVETRSGVTFQKAVQFISLSLRRRGLGATNQRRERLPRTQRPGILQYARGKEDRKTTPKKKFQKKKSGKKGPCYVCGGDHWARECKERRTEKKLNNISASEQKDVLWAMGRRRKVEVRPRAVDENALQISIERANGLSWGSRRVSRVDPIQVTVRLDREREVNIRTHARSGREEITISFPTSDRNTDAKRHFSNKCSRKSRRPRQRASNPPRIRRPSPDFEWAPVSHVEEKTATMDASLAEEKKSEMIEPTLDLEEKEPTMEEKETTLEEKEPDRLFHMAHPVDVSDALYFNPNTGVFIPNGADYTRDEMDDWIRMDEEAAVEEEAEAAIEEEAEAAANREAGPIDSVDSARPSSPMSPEPNYSPDYDYSPVHTPIGPSYSPEYDPMWSDSELSEDAGNTLSSLTPVPPPMCFVTEHILYDWIDATTR